MPELKYRANFGIDIYNSSQDTFRPSTIPVANTEGNPESEPEATAKTAKMYNWLFEQTVTYNKDIKGHSISALAGWTMQYQRDESTYAFANGFITNNVPTLNAGTVTRGDSHASEWALLSGLARVNIIIKVNIWLLEHFVQMVPLVLVRIIVGVVPFGIGGMAFNGRAFYEIIDLY